MFIKFFGDNPSKVLPMVQDGATKEEILEKTGHTVGLDNVSIKVEEGETFCMYGLIWIRKIYAYSPH